MWINVFVVVNNYVFYFINYCDVVFFIYFFEIIRMELIFIVYGGFCFNFIILIIFYYIVVFCVNFIWFFNRYCIVLGIYDFYFCMGYSVFNSFDLFFKWWVNVSNMIDRVIFCLIIIYDDFCYMKFIMDFLYEFFWIGIICYNVGF